MNTQSLRAILAGLIAIASPALYAAAPAAADKLPEPLGADVGYRLAEEDPAPVMEEVIVVGMLLNPYADVETLEAQLREQTLKLTEQLDAAIESELKELLAPKLEIDRG